MQLGRAVQIMFNGGGAHCGGWLAAEDGGRSTLAHRRIHRITGVCDPSPPLAPPSQGGASVRWPRENEANPPGGNVRTQSVTGNGPQTNF